MLILASASEARHRLLENARIEHRIMISNFDENSVKKNDPKILVQCLATAKAKKVFSKIKKEEETFNSENKIYSILGCDSVFEFQDEILGKPNTKDEAMHRLKLMSCKKGFLHTGHTLLFQKDLKTPTQNHEIVNTVISTEIEFCNLNHKEIEDYVDSGEPLCCAGCFTLEGEGSKFIKSINGCYTNVIGISIPWLNETLYKAKVF